MEELEESLLKEKFLIIQGIVRCKTKKDLAIFINALNTLYDPKGAFNEDFAKWLIEQQA